MVLSERIRVVRGRNLKKRVGRRRLCKHRVVEPAFEGIVNKLYTSL